MNINAPAKYTRWFLSLAALLCIGALSLVGCSSPGTTSVSASEIEPTTIEVTHSLGTVEVSVNPESVAVLDLASLDIIDALDAGDSVVGMPKQSYVSYLASYNENESIADLGTVKEVDMEALQALEPDVIFIGSRLEEQYESLSQIAPVVLVTTDTINVLDSVQSNTETFAKIFEKEDAVSGLISGFEERIAELQTAVEGKTAVVGMVTSGSLNTLGNESRCSLIGNEIGFENLAADVNSTHGDSSSFELVLELNPEYLFVLDRDTAIQTEGAETAQKIMENEIIMKTDAYKNDNIIYLTPDAWYLAEGGITATDIMLQDLENGVLSN